MMRFCPHCSNHLEVQPVTDNMSEFILRCNACEYDRKITGTLSDHQSVKKKQMDDVLGGAEAWANVDSTAIKCPKCSHNRAYYMQIQTRSADEPMSQFYKCCNVECSYRWRLG